VAAVVASTDTYKTEVFVLRRRVAELERAVRALQDENTILKAAHKASSSAPSAECKAAEGDSVRVHESIRASASSSTSSDGVVVEHCDACADHSVEAAAQPIDVPVAVAAQEDDDDWTKLT
jgi:hypothetical protein